MGREQVEQAKKDLNFTEQVIQERLAGITNLEEGNRVFDGLKQEAKKLFKKLALELHPDRTQNDPEKTERFKVLVQVMEAIEQLRLQPKPQPRMITVIVQSYGNATVTNTSTATGMYSGRWIRYG
jgi:hypothetical protein